MPRALLLLTLLLPALAAHAQDPVQVVNEPADITGYVTRVASPSDFDVNGIRVVIHHNAILRFNYLGQVRSIEHIDPFLGQRVDLWGRKDSKHLAIDTYHIILYQPQPLKVSGIGIIDLVPDTPNRFRADGHMLDLSSAVPTLWIPQPAGSPPAAGLAGLGTNVWINSRGTRRPDGAIAVEKATYAPNAISTKEANFLRKTDYDPAAVPDDAHQNLLHTQVLGVDFKKIPPFNDPALQARIDRIGQSLIPAFQKTLPTGDPTRINFRFQLIDAENWHDAVALASGIILIPFQVVQRLPDDAELAAILADNIATALEKQVFRLMPTREELLAAEAIGTAASFINPIGALAGLAAGVGSIAVQKNALTQSEQQSGRVALCLMHDAGYDIAKAPEAWWTLASKPNKNPHRNPPPARAVNQFIELGTTWHPLAEPNLKPRQPPPTP